MVMRNTPGGYRSSRKSAYNLEINIKPEPFDLKEFATFPVLRAFRELKIHRTHKPQIPVSDKVIQTKDAVLGLQLAFCVVAQNSDRTEIYCNLRERNVVGVLNQQTFLSVDLLGPMRLFTDIFETALGGPFAKPPSDSQKNEAFGYIHVLSGKFDRLGYRAVADEILAFLSREGYEPKALPPAEERRSKKSLMLPVPSV
ncbi:MAG: hypothetical protein PHE27_09245 [Alphaproteobacteria bacterium]|nr:hypothetical protein [Alphaproteobacteria bacterium]